MERDGLFLAQYNQVWEQRRQHVVHIWAIPAIVVALTGIFVTLLIYNKINFSTHILGKLVSASLIYIGFFGLFCRHNYFIRVLGLLLKDLAKNQNAESDLPQFGDDFRERFERDLKNPLDKFGSLRSGTFWWFIVTGGVLLFMTVNWWPKFKGLLVESTNLLDLFQSGVLPRLIFYGIISIAAFLKLRDAVKDKRRWHEILLWVGLFFYTTFSTLGNGQNLIRPFVVISEEFSSDRNNIQFKKKPDENIYFQTRFPVEKPIVLSIKDSFNNLVSNQYQILDDKRTVFINFMFEDNDQNANIFDSNRNAAKRGFVFDYETRLWLFNRAYTERKQAKSYKEVGID